MAESYAGKIRRKSLKKQHIVDVAAGRSPADLALPEGFTPDSICMETSTCTGERTIGFFDPADRKLHRAELVRREEDIAAFYAKYGLSRPE